MVRVVYPNVLTASWAYDANGQLLQVKNAFPTNTISQYDYVYDAAGRRINVSKSGSAFDHGDTISYGYNARSELTNAVAAIDSDYRYAYDFDDIGNRETSSERGTNSVYAANNLNQYTAVDDFTPQFDDDGNQTLIKTATGIWQVQYNGENRPILWICTQSDNPSITNNQTISMSFDRMGRRVTKNDQRFVYDGYLQIANFEYQTSNIKPQTFIWDPTEPVATRPLAWTHGNSVAYYTHDGNKNVSEVVSVEGDVSVHYEYAPFGAARIMHGESASLNPWRFSSEFAEDEVEMVYYNYRHYEPNSSRWECRDPYGERAGLSLYCFLANRGDGVCDALGLAAIPAGVPVDEFFTNPANKKKYPLYEYVSVNAYEIKYNNSMGNFFSFIPWQKVELKEYYWRVEFTARFSPPLQLQVDKSYNSWGANALGGAGDSYEPVSYVGDLPQDAWGIPTVFAPQLSFAGYIIRQNFSFENKKFRFGYFVYKADCDGCEFSQIGSNPDMYSTWFKYAARKHPSDDLVADGHRTPCQTVVVLYGDAGRGTPLCRVFKGKWRSGK